jgi:hypothetical protein
MFERRWTTLLFPLLLGASTACSDDVASDPGAHVTTGLPANEKFSSFDDDDAKAACQALNDGASELISERELIRAQCAAAAIGATLQVNEARTEVSVDIAKCDELTKSCESDPASYGVMGGEARYDSDCSDTVANDRVLNCDATVADYEACISKVLDRAKQALVKTSCANSKELIESDGAATQVDPMSIPECKTFLGQCPDIQIAVDSGE